MTATEDSQIPQDFCNQVVRASAGTGKTTTLVALYLRGIERRLEPGEILAITFTKKAAGEMRSRLKEEVFRRINAPAASGEASRWRRVLQELSAAPISTIHAFCGRILRENPIPSGLDPHFVELDDEQAYALRREAISESIAKALREEDRTVEELFAQFDLERRFLYGRGGLVESIERTMEWLGSLGVDLNLVDERGRRWIDVKLDAQEQAVEALKSEFFSMREEVGEAFRRVADMKGKVRGANATKWTDKVHEALPSILAALENLTPEAPAEAIRTSEFLVSLCKPGRLGDQGFLEAPLTTLRAFVLGGRGRGSLFGHFGALKGMPLSRWFNTLVARCQGEFKRRKREANALDFSDLLCEARNLLKAHLVVRRRYKERFSLILVDEFQDTDRVQGEILALLAEARAVQGVFPLLSTLDEVLDRVLLDPNRIAIVGDPKQSIYGFRQADVGVFLAMSEKLKKGGGEERDLVENYRSSQEILHFVNQLCRTMAERRSGEEEEGFAARHRIPFSPAEDLRLPEIPLERQKRPGRVLLLRADPGSRAGPGRLEESRRIAALIHAMVQKGEVKGYGEVAILLRDWQRARSFAEPFRRREIPFYLVRGVGFYERPEIIDLCSFLAFIKDPGDDLALATVLTSPLAGGNFADLKALHGAREHSGQPLHQVLLDRDTCFLPDGAVDRLKPFLALCREALRCRDRRTPAEILELALERSGYEGVLAALEGGEQRLANAGKLIEMARAASRRGLSTLSDFAERMREHMHSRRRAPEAPVYGEGEDVVRMMTVHQAKGLEFEAVILPSLAGKGGKEETHQEAFDGDLGVLCTAASGPNRALLPNTLMERAVRQGKDRRFEEEKRLLYVAATRARRILVLSEGFGSRQGSWMKWVEEVIGRGFEGTAGLEDRPPGSILLPGMSVEVVRPECETPVVSAAPGVGEEVLGTEEIKAAGERAFHWSAPRPPLLELTPSALEDFSLCSRYYFLSRKAGLRDRTGHWLLPPAGLVEGEVVHRVLKRWDRSLPAEDPRCRQRELSRLMGRDESALVLPPERRREMIAHLSRYLGSDTWSSLRQNPFLRRELPFQLRLEGKAVTLLISGRMDAVAPRPGNPLVIETKYAEYDSHGAENYRLSAVIYALASLRQAGAPRATARLVFLRNDPPAEVEFVVDSPGEVEAELLGLAEDCARRGLSHNPQDWSRIARVECDRIGCGFRSYCWGTGTGSR